MSWKKVYVFSILALLVMPVAVMAIGSTVEWSSLGAGSWLNALKYIFGKIPADISDNAISAAIVTVAVWGMIVLTFGDIFATFTTFSKWVSWVVAVLVGIIAANVGFSVVMIAWVTGVMAFAGAFAVWLALGAALVAFVAVNLGITRLGPWLMRRRAMEHASKADAGGTKLAGTIKGLGAAGKALEKI
ncbi:MAG: hypothetical protein ABIH72_05170 [archaeon]